MRLNLEKLNKLTHGIGSYKWFYFYVLHLLEKRIICPGGKTSPGSELPFNIKYTLVKKIEKIAILGFLSLFFKPLIMCLCSEC